jgi:hypothetical protein
LKAEYADIMTKMRPLLSAHQRTSRQQKKLAELNKNLVTWKEKCKKAKSTFARAMEVESPICTNCESAEIGDLHHILIRCPAHQPFRDAATTIIDRLVASDKNRIDSLPQNATERCKLFPIWQPDELIVDSSPYVGNKPLKSFPRTWAVTGIAPKELRSVLSDLVQPQRIGKVIDKILLTLMHTSSIIVRNHNRLREMRKAQQRAAKRERGRKKRRLRDRGAARARQRAAIRLSRAANSGGESRRKSLHHSRKGGAKGSNEVEEENATDLGAQAATTPRETAPKGEQRSKRRKKIQNSEKSIESDNDEEEDGTDVGVQAAAMQATFVSASSPRSPGKKRRRRLFEDETLQVSPFMHPKRPRETAPKGEQRHKRRKRKGDQKSEQSEEDGMAVTTPSGDLISLQGEAYQRKRKRPGGAPMI